MIEIIISIAILLIGGLVITLYQRKSKEELILPFQPVELKPGKILIRLEGVKGEKKFERTKFIINEVVKLFKEKPIVKSFLEKTSDPYGLYPRIEIDDQLWVEGREVTYSQLFDLITELLQKKAEETKKTREYFIKKRNENAYFICWNNAYFIDYQAKGNRILVPTSKIKFRSKDFKVYPIIQREGIPASDESLASLEERAIPFFDFTPYDRKYQREGGFTSGGFLKM